MSSAAPVKPSLVDEVRKNPPGWAHQKLRYFNALQMLELKPFVIRAYHSDRASVDLSRVVGTTHPDYGGISWADLLESGKRQGGNLFALTTGPDYYLDTRRKLPEMPYLSFDGWDFYIYGNGNHRTCIARLFLHYQGITWLHGVNLTRQEIDWEMRDLFLRLQDVCAERAVRARLEPYGRPMGRVEGPTWAIEHFRPAIAFWATSDRSPTLLDAEGARRRLAELTRPRFRRFFALPWGVARRL